ncbi:hypothetical protein [Bacillus sp. UNC41MFS5]|uniref:hypothetical protein n=1 Tax=Bacillus sp. UNC41MFS5 TaxID=1449046 RepID=UPI001E39D920|nr:hypothetical protein [Bacillus sp. UNC41MFS5]
MAAEFLALLNTVIVTVASCSMLFLHISNFETWSLNNKFPQILLHTISLISWSGDKLEPESESEPEPESESESESEAELVSVLESEKDLNGLLQL